MDENIVQSNPPANGVECECVWCSPPCVGGRLCVHTAISVSIVWRHGAGYGAAETHGGAGRSAVVLKPQQLNCGMDG